eukprot:2631209-Prymnesium_polylepis.1
MSGLSEARSSCGRANVTWTVLGMEPQRRKRVRYRSNLYCAAVALNGRLASAAEDGLRVSLGPASLGCARRTLRVRAARMP